MLLCIKGLYRVHCCFLYADDLLLMEPTKKQLGRCIAGWRVSLLDKRLKVNVGNSKVMLGGSGGR